MSHEESVEVDHRILISLLASFPDKEKMNDGRSWLPLHFALTLGDVVREEDVHILHLQDPLAMQRYSLKNSNNGRTGYIPAHFLCMQKHPNIQLMRYLSLRDMKSFTMSFREEDGDNPVGRNPLQLAAECSESVELLKSLMQIDHSMARCPRNQIGYTSGYTKPVTALGFLCERSQFSSFHDMFQCLIAADSSYEVVRDALICCFKFYGRSNCTDIKVVLALIESLLQANTTIMNHEVGYENYKIFHWACEHLEGELGVSVLSLLSTKCDNEVATWLLPSDPNIASSVTLPIHYAANNSSLNVLKLLLELCPESIYQTDPCGGGNLLHDVVCENRQDRAPVNAKVQYLCDHYPNLLNMSDKNDHNPLNRILSFNFHHIAARKLGIQLDLQTIKIMCETDKTIVTKQCLTGSYNKGWLPIHHLVSNPGIDFLTSNMSVEADCFRYLLHLYPASAGIKNDRGHSTYDLAVKIGRNDYLLRLLLNSDLTIDPKRRHDLNSAARKDAMFLAFRALTSNPEPSIWIKLRCESGDLLKHTICYL
jgi:hypothetical protein